GAVRGGAGQEGSRGTRETSQLPPGLPSSVATASACPGAGGGPYAASQFRAGRQCRARRRTALPDVFGSGRIVKAFLMETWHELKRPVLDLLATSGKPAVASVAP